MDDPAPWTEAGVKITGKVIETIGDITISTIGKVVETTPTIIKDIITPEIEGGGRSLKVIYLIVLLTALYLLIRKNKKGERFLFSFIKDAKDEVKEKKEKKPKNKDEEWTQRRLLTR